MKVRLFDGHDGLSVVDLMTALRFTVVPDGYGLSYSIGDDYIRWTMTSLKRGTAELKHYLAEAATETRTMLDRAAAKRKEKPKL